MQYHLSSTIKSTAIRSAGETAAPPSRREQSIESRNLYDDVTRAAVPRAFHGVFTCISISSRRIRPVYLPVISSASGIYFIDTIRWAIRHQNNKNHDLHIKDKLQTPCHHPRSRISPSQFILHLRLKNPEFYYRTYIKFTSSSHRFVFTTDVERRRRHNASIS